VLLWAHWIWQRGVLHSWLMLRDVAFVECILKGWGQSVPSYMRFLFTTDVETKLCLSRDKLYSKRNNLRPHKTQNCLWLKMRAQNRIYKRTKLLSSIWCVGILDGSGICERALDVRITNEWWFGSSWLGGSRARRSSIYNVLLICPACLEELLSCRIDISLEPNKCLLWSNFCFYDLSFSLLFMYWSLREKAVSSPFRKHCIFLTPISV